MPLTTPLHTPSPTATAAPALATGHAAAPGRRAWLRRGLWGAALVAAPALVRPALAQGTAMPTPRQTEGPYYPVDIPADSDADLLRNGMLRYTQGQAVWVEGRVTDTQGVPLAGGTVEIWQCDAAGHYHHPRSRGSAAWCWGGTAGTAFARSGLRRTPAARRTSTSRCGCPAANC